MRIASYDMIAIMIRSCDMIAIMIESFDMILMMIYKVEMIAITIALNSNISIISNNIGFSPGYARCTSNWEKFVSNRLRSRVRRICEIVTRLWDFKS